MDVTVSILTGPKPLPLKKCSQVLLPTVTGTTAILKGHAPMLSALEIGLLRIKQDYGIWTPIVLCGSGVAYTRDDVVHIMVFTLEEEFNEDLDTLNKVVDEATLELQQAKTAKTRLDAILKLKRNMARYEGRRFTEIKKSRLAELKLQNKL
jgi:F-type H+-transporting ATPase subunit epsilon